VASVVRLSSSFLEVSVLGLELSVSYAALALNPKCWRANMPTKNHTLSHAIVHRLSIITIEVPMKYSVVLRLGSYSSLRYALLGTKTT
jgi:hypothetical protein